MQSGLSFDRSAPSGAEVKGAWHCTFVVTVRLRAVVLSSARDNWTVPLRMSVFARSVGGMSRCPNYETE